MPRPRFPYLQREVTRHRVTVWYVRAGKGPRIRIHGDYGSPDFVAAYMAALAGNQMPNPGEGESVKLKIGAKPVDRGYIYFAGAGTGGPIKIGFAKDVFDRLAELQTSHHEKLVIFHAEKGTRRDEAKFHGRFSHLRRRGEWFKREGELAEFLSGPTRRPRTIAER